MSRPKKRAGSSRALPAADAPDVEEILRAAEDEILIGLHSNSHTISSPSLDLDLARRFETLKTPRFITSSKAKQPIAPSKIPETNNQTSSDVTNDDLMARFAALTNPSSKPKPVTDPILYRDDSADDEHSEDDEGGGKVSKKEVEKVIMWAMDAARLDDSVGNNEENEEDEFVNELEAEVEEKKKRGKGKGARGKWFSVFR